MSQEPPEKALIIRNDSGPLRSSPDLVSKYKEAFEATGYDKSRTLWIGDLKAWMDEDYFKNVCSHFGEDDVPVAVITNEQTRSPEYAFIEFKSPEAAEQILWRCNGFTMPNSTKIFDFRWALLVCELKRPDGCFDYKSAPSDLSYLYESSFHRCLVSIEFVKVKHINSAKRPIRLYGKVVIGSGSENNVLVVYHRSIENSQCVNPGDFLTLTGPLLYARGLCGFFIRAKLLEVDSSGDGNDQIAKGEMSQNLTAKGEFSKKRIAGNMSPDQIVESGFSFGSRIMSPNSHKFDQPLEQDIHCEFGTLTVGYSEFENALNATFEVLLTEMYGCGYVHGFIAAVQHIGESGTCVTLFERSKNEAVQVRYNHVSLARSVVVIPDTGLSIDVRLWTKEGDEIADGAKCITPEAGRQIVKIGKVQVSVSIC